MADYIEIATTNDIHEGKMKRVVAGEHEFVLARSGGRIYCADNLCPHLGGNLSDGILRGGVITCPMHHSQFDLTDGHVIRWTDLTGIILTIARNTRPPRPLRVYPVKIEGDKILIAY